MNSLSVRIDTPQRLVWKGEAVSVSSENSEGKFDVLPEHANMITLIKNKPIVVDIGKEKKKFEFKKAILLTRENRARIFADL